MKRFFAVLYACACICVFAASAAMPAPLRVSLVIEGQLGDQSFFDSASRGFAEAKQKLGITGQILECNEDPANYLPYLATAAKQSDLVLTVGFALQDMVEELAPKTPSVDFVYYDVIGGCRDVTYAAFKQAEGSFLAGALAAMMTTRSGDPRINSDKIIGTVIGEDLPVMREFLQGYQQGAAYIDPSVKVLYGFVGSWSDPAAGKEMALNQYKNGADVIYQLAGGTGEGIIAAAKERGFYAIGVDSPQEHLAPGVVLTSMLKRLDIVTFNLIKARIDGTFKRGGHYVYGLREGGVSLSWSEEALKAIPTDVKTRLDQIAANISSDNIVVKVQNK